MRWPSPPDRARGSLDDGTVGIRPQHPDDVGPLLDAVRESLDELGPWMGWAHPGYSLADAAEWIELQDRAWDAGERFGFAIVDIGTGRFLGVGGLNRIDPVHRWANAGYWVRSSATGAGVATRALRLMARFAFEVLEFGRIEVVADVDNVASRRVAERAGAVFEGIARNRLSTRGRSRDGAVYGLVPGSGS